jgi:transposase
MADGVPITDVAATVGISRRFVYKWVQRFLEQGMEGLADKPRPGYQRVPRPAALAESPRLSA